MPPIDPVIVSELIPVGTVTVTEVDDVPFAMTILAGTTTEELADKDTVTFSLACFDKLNLTVACPPAGAGLGEMVTPLSASSMHGMFCTCCGGAGGVVQGTLTKSKNSLISGWAASRAVRLGRRKRVSMNFRIAV